MLRPPPASSPPGPATSWIPLSVCSLLCCDMDSYPIYFSTLMLDSKTQDSATMYRWNPLKQRLKINLPSVVSVRYFGHRDTKVTNTPKPEVYKQKHCSSYRYLVSFNFHKRNSLGQALPKTALSKGLQKSKW